MNLRRLVESTLSAHSIVKRSSIWQLQFINSDTFSEFSRKKGIKGYSGRDIQILWQINLLKADLISSTTKINADGFIEVSTNEYEYFYADERTLRPYPDGLFNLAVNLPELSENLKIFFHPFRLYVLHSIHKMLHINLHPMQPLINSMQAAHQVIEIISKQLQNLASSVTLVNLLEEWNSITELAVISEPCFYEDVFHQRKLFTAEEEYKRLVEEHRRIVEEIYSRIEVSQVEQARRLLVTNAEELESNKDLYRLIRLARGDFRLNLEGKVGRGIYFITMAEVLRRGVERTLNTELKEEDELTYSIVLPDWKKDLYGSNRVFDRDYSVAKQVIDRLGLNYDVRLRWYVEGQTEYGALRKIIGRYLPIEIVNLRGHVVENKIVAFRDSLRADIESNVFSFISIDGDREDYIRAVQKAAQEDELCGMFFITFPDFELGNFTIQELVDILWEVAREYGASPEKKQDLVNAVVGATSGGELLKRAKKIVFEINQLDKGYIWGEKLVDFAFKHPIHPTTNKYRPIVQAIQFAIHGASVADYILTRREYRVDPKTGQPVKRIQPN